MKRFNIKAEQRSGRFKTESVGKITFNQRKPKISFEFLNGDYCISKCQQNQKAEIIDSLHRISQHTWQEHHQIGKSGGYEQFGRDQLRCKIPHEEKFINTDKVTVFHRKDKIPIVGFRVDDVFYVFCIDRDFSAYKH